MSEKISIKDILNHDLDEFARFSSMLSKTVHDINNPLAVFIGQLSIVELLEERNELTPDKLKKIFDKFKSSSETFKSRLDHLRNFYKVPINDQYFKKTNQILESICYYFDNEAFKNSIDIRLINETDKEIEINIEANKLFIIIKHLIQNSIESLASLKKEGGLISVKCTRLENKLNIAVIDNGPGLVCALEMATETGYTTKAERHPGLGLSIINQILKENNLTLNYEKSENCTFSVNYAID